MELSNIQLLFDDPGTTPEAIGTAFLLSSEYLGTPGALSSSTPGFIAQSTGITGGMYILNPSVALNPNTEYWVYENALVNITGTTVGVGTPTEHACGSNGNNFVTLPGSIANLSVNGNVSGAPERSTFALIGAAISSLLLMRRRT